MSPISMHVVSAVSENDGSAPKANGYSVPAINESEGSTPRVNGYDAPTLNGNDSSIPTINGFHSNDTKTNGHLANAKLNGDIPVKPTQTPHEPIAIIGMGCRLPGGASSSSKLWDLLIAGGSGQCGIPPSRFNIDGFYHPNADRPGSMNTAGGYFLKEDIRAFENSFFGINNLEATYMDPQQRKLLEVVYECFESAGVSLQKVAGSNTGCYVGNFTTDFLVLQGKDNEHIHRYSATGMGTTILANRISHVFDLKGPSFVLDTACSSSLYCLHVACAALDAGECDSAIVAGANLIQSPEQHMGTMKAGVLSQTSTCHTFDDSADGYGRAEGVGALLVKRLSDAIRDGDPIRSVVRGTAANSNGKTPGITLPSAAGQEAVIRKAYAKAGLDYDGTDYVEAHGTGTPVGDPIEVEAIASVFKRTADNPLLIGAVKTNLGHSEAASGISSIIKVTLALEQGLIPKTIGVTRINPKIKAEEWGIKIVTQNTTWPEGPSGHVRRASINSFGYGGANSHAILDAAEAYVVPCVKPSSDVPALSRTTFLLPFSGNTEAAMNHQLNSIVSMDLQNTSMEDLAYTLGVRRSSLSVRGFLLAGHKPSNSDISLDNLKTRLDGNHYSPLPFAFVFTGQGAQWPEMGKELIEELPAFRHSLQQLDMVLQSLQEPPTWTLQAAILEGASKSKVNHVSRSQPVCTAIQIAIVQLLYQWGIVPQAVVGHSSGEIAAAYAAGQLTASQAIVIAYLRGDVVSRSTSHGAMMAVGLGPERAASEIQHLGLDGAVKVACINSPESITLSGDASAIDETFTHLQNQGTFARKLKTDGRAYHSHHMIELGQEYEDILISSLSSLVKLDRPVSTVEWTSSVTGKLVRETPSANYWRTNLVSPVQFASAVKGLLEKSTYHFIEVGPHSALELPIKQIRTALNVSENKLHYSSALYRGKNSMTTMLTLLGNLYLHGHNIAFDRINLASSAKSDFAKQGARLLQPQRKVLTHLAPYHWSYDTELWAESRLSIEYRNRRYPRHDLLGSHLPGGDGVVTTWRNVLKVKDVPWLGDHGLEQSIVLPGAAYIAMAIEAICQVTNTSGADLPSFSLRNINILKACVLSHEMGIEVFTSIQPLKLSATTRSGTWWLFTISSYIEGTPTDHANGSIRLEDPQEPIHRELCLEEDLMEPHAVRTWYSKFAKEGLNFGPSFQSLDQIYSHRGKKLMHAVAKTDVRVGGGVGIEQQSSYIVHPVTIDALLQTAIIASASGTVNNLRAKVPVIIGSAKIRSPQPSSLTQQHTISAVSEPVGFETIRMRAELRDANDNVCVQLQQSRGIAFQGGAQDQPADERYPMLRVSWEPDIERLWTADNGGFSNYLDRTGSGTDEIAKKFSRALGLIAHKRPIHHVLDLSDGRLDVTKALLNSMEFGSPFKRCQKFSRGQMSNDQKLSTAKIKAIASLDTDSHNLIEYKYEEPFDVIIVSPESEFDITANLELIQRVLSPHGMLLSLCSFAASQHLRNNGFSVLTARCGGSELILARSGQADQPDIRSTVKECVLVEGNADHPLNAMLASKLSDYIGYPVSRVPLGMVAPNHIKPKTTVISTIELEDPLLATMTSGEMTMIKTITDNASHLLWITGGNLLRGSRPDFALASGLSRSIMHEQPSLRFLTYDVDELTSSHEVTASNIVSVLAQAVEDSDPDFEYVQNSGVLHVSRFTPEEGLNRSFRRKLGSETVPMTLEDASPCQIGIENPGQFDSIYFSKNPIAHDVLKPNFIRIEVKSVGLNAKDLYALGGKVDTTNATCTLEYSGVVLEVGSKVSSVSPGDRILAHAPGHFKTIECAPEWACHKMNDDEDFHVSPMLWEAPYNSYKSSANGDKALATLSAVFMSAMYALHDRAHIQPGESVLIHSGAGGLGIAAIQICKLVGAEIFATVGTDAKKDFLVDKYGLRRDHIFKSRDSSFLQGVLDATSGRGVDIVLNSLTGDLLHDSWMACADFGRFVEVGKRDITDSGMLDMTVFSRNVTFTAFDFSNLYDMENVGHQRIRERLLKQTVALYREGKIKAIDPLRVFDVSEITQAYRYFSTGTRIGKVAISLEDPKSMVKVLPSKYQTMFHSDKFYFLVGCLGGLGRSISKWMFERGARKFVFLGRSGADKAPAQRLVEDLQLLGAHITVARGDVGVYSDVIKAVEGVEGPLGGVVQAAMGLDEALFTTMSCDQWHTGIDPKLVGTWNLHHAIKDREQELDFFLMTSSISGSVGTATESNYCAANYFLDMFARYRKSLGLPATSIGLGMISEVGYLHENPEIEAMLLRKGIQAINEDELLQIIDISLSTTLSDIDSYDKYAENHVLTGLEPLGIKELRKAGFEGDTPAMNDPRALLLVNALAADVASGSHNVSSGMPTELAAAFESGGSVSDAVLSIVAKKFSNLILIAAEKLDTDKPLPAFGIDSMLAAEFRTWFYTTFKVDIPFLTLLSQNITIRALAEKTTDEVLAARAG